MREFPLDRLTEAVKQLYLTANYEIGPDVEGAVCRACQAEESPVGRRVLAQLAEKLRFSDPMSDDQLADLENRIGAKIAELSTAADKTAIIEELDSLLEERNRKCKTLK